MIIFIFPFHRIGGAEKVHSEIIKAIADHKKIYIIFDGTDGSPISREFNHYAHIKLGDSKLKRMLCIILVILASWVIPLTLFGCNSLLFYRLLPKVSNRSIKIDLTHAFSFPDPGIEDYAKYFVPYLSTRIVINNKTLEDYREQYLREGINLSYMERFKIIPNGVYINQFDDHLIQARYKNFTIGYVGRYAKEKRPDLFLKLIKMDRLPEFQAKMIVDKFENPIANYDNLSLILGVTDPIQVRKEFSTMSVLIITSEREGFPLVIMEAMELGIPVISANVGSIREHVINGFNGYIFYVIDDESFLINCHQKIEIMGSDKQLYTDLCLNARRYAVEHFNIKDMHKAYRKLLLNE